MKERFEGPENLQKLIDAISTQKLLTGVPEAAVMIANCGELFELTAGADLIHEGGGDDDAYFVLLGQFSIVVKAQAIATRGVGDCVGEMSAIDSSLPRSATVRSNGLSVVIKVTRNNFNAIADHHPTIWKNISKELTKRLHQRNKLLTEPNETPRVFIISSKEALPIALELQAILRHVALPVAWPDGIFFASGYALEALEQEVDKSDFAIAVAQPDDTATSRGTTTSVVRDNVIFELGLFMGRIGRRRTILFQPAGQELRLPSDLHGLMAVSYKLGDAKDITSHISAASHEIRKLIGNLGVRKSRYGAE
jgi:predicted nucleotide-binding protein